MDGGCAQGEKGDAVQLLELEVYAYRVGLWLDSWGVGIPTGEVLFGDGFETVTVIPWLLALIQGSGSIFAPE